MTSDLRSALRAATRDWHARAERAGVMRTLLRGELDAPGYGRLLGCLLVIYDAMEHELARNRAHPVLAPLRCERLARAAALRSDLAALGVADTPAFKPAVLGDYGDRLAAIGREAPALLAAHAYVRYLGDLSGGAVLARIAGARYGPVAFYDFGPPPRADGLRRDFVDALAAQPADAGVVDEACSAFARHVSLFEALDGAAHAAGAS